MSLHSKIGIKYTGQFFQIAYAKLTHAGRTEKIAKKKLGKQVKELFKFILHT